MTDATDTTRYIGKARTEAMGKDARLVLSMCINAHPGALEGPLATSRDTLPYYSIALATNALRHSYEHLSAVGQAAAGKAMQVLGGTGLPVHETPTHKTYATTYHVGQGVAYRGEHGWFVSSLNMAPGEGLAPGSKVASLTITNRTTCPWGEVTLTHAELDAAVTFESGYSRCRSRREGN